MEIEPLMYRDRTQPNRFTAKAAACLACLLALTLCANAAEEYYSGGTGEPSNPFKISKVADWQDLMATEAHWVKPFILTADLDLEGIPLTPIGNYADKFIGVFDGNDHVIRNAYINMPGADHVGLFGYLGAGGEIGGLAAEDISIVGSSKVGGLVGVNDTGFVGSCHLAGSVSGDRSLGGLVGWNSGSVSDSFWDISTSGRTTSAGGTPKMTLEMKTETTFTSAGWDFVGETVNGTEEIWTIDEGYDYPRLVWGSPLFPPGPYSGGSGTEAKPFRIATVIDWQDLIATEAHWDKHFVLTADLDLEGVALTPIGTSFSNSFTGVVDGNDRRIRNADVNMPSSNYVGLFGHMGADAEIKNLHAEDVSMSGKYCVGGLVGLSYGGRISNCHSTGLVSGTDGYVGGLAGGSIEGTVIGCYSTASVSAATGDYIGGLAGRASGIVSDSYSAGSVNGGTGYAVGGLVGESCGTISNCRSNISVTATNDYLVGGLVGLNSQGSISECHSTVSVGGTYSVGGLVGCNSDIIDRSYSTGPVTGSEWVGGFAGRNYHDATISNCWSTGSVIGGSEVGGLVGQNGWDEYGCELCCDGDSCWEDCWDYYYFGWIYNCYSTGKVSGASAIGGLVGSHELGEVGDSFWDTITSECSGSDAGEGMTTAQMQNPNTFLSAGWDFVDIWTICEGANYPRFFWQVPVGDVVCPDGVNGLDFAAVARYWQETDCVALDDCEGADIDMSGAVDFADVAAVAESWLSGL